MSNFEKFDFEEALLNCKTVEEIDLLLKKAEVRKRCVETEAVRKKTEAEIKTEEAKRNDMLRRTESEIKTEEIKRRNMIKITGKDIVAMIPQVITAAVGILTIVSAVSQTRYKANTDLAIAKNNNDTKARLTDRLTKTNESEILVDKPIKVYNEINR